MTRHRDYKKEYRDYQGTPEQIHNRSLRNQARREMAKEGKVHKGDGMEVDHKHMLIKGGSNAKSNLRVITAARNRGWRDGKV
jgi:hypothetical protein